MIKKIGLILCWTGSVFCMDEQALQQGLMKQMRNHWYSQVPQANTDDGLIKATKFFGKLNDEQIAPGVTFEDARRFHEERSHLYPETAQIIVRFYNCAIERAFLLQKGKEIPDAIEVVKANGYDRSYILTGNRNSILDEFTFSAKLDHIAMLIKNTPPLYHWLNA